MSIREKIIVVCALLAVLYGVYVFGIPMITATRIADDTPTPRIQELKNFADEVRSKLSMEGFSEPDEYIIQKASVKWDDNPFLSSELSVESEPPEAQVEALLEKLEIIYSGYLMMGTRELAIINGMEYEIGEEVIGCDGCIITDISPFQVELKTHKKKLVVPVKEDGENLKIEN
jgi:hypothetical protein